MVEVVLKVSWPVNILGVRPPAAIARETHLKVNQRVRMSAQAGRLSITTVGDVPLTIDQRLAFCEPECVGGDARLASPACGAVRW